jgi:nifR3 family TIM-barrel protein
MNFSWDSIKKPVFVLAPMANITTMPFRSICREMGADIVYTPMLSSNAIIHNPEKTLKIASFLSVEEPVIVQLFGYDGDLLAKAANIVQNALKPAGIDINLGCPAPKITGNECGSALLKDLEKAKSIIEIIRKEYRGELSVKLRLGWSEFDILDFTKNLEKIGVNAISIHGRTAKQGYRGKVNWQAINEIAKVVKISVIGNGDIKSWQEAYQKLENSKLAGIMIGRGALGNPWIFKEIKKKEDFHIDKDELTRVIKLQTERYIDFVGEKKAVLEMRKHLDWYIRGFEKAKEIRKEAMKATRYKDLLEVLEMIRLS